MNLSQIIDVLPLQVYVRRGELVIHFSTPADLVSRLAETSAVISDLDRQSDTGRPERPGRRPTIRTAAGSGSPPDPEADRASAAAGDPEANTASKS